VAVAVESSVERREWSGLANWIETQALGVDNALVPLRGAAGVDVTHEPEALIV
jgi:hypothetical protein